MSRPTVLRPLALLAVPGAIALAFGQGAAAARADGAGEVQALQAQVKQLTERVAALDAMIATRNRVVTISGGRADNDILLRGNPLTSHSLTVGNKDAVLDFRRITLIADEITLSGKKTIVLKAPAITLDGQVTARASSGVILKGFTVKDN